LWAESPEINGWSLAGVTYEEVRRLAEDGVSFALSSEAEARGDGFDEGRFVGGNLEHEIASG
jgi:hypothetical protein